MKNELVVLIGTKGQMTKMFPVLQELDKRKIDYIYIQSNQHPKFNETHSKYFKLKDPDLTLWDSKEDLKSIKETVKWFWRCLWVLYRNRKLFQGKIIITHGDTLSTLLAIITGKLYKCKIVHIESGLRSYSLLHPFPEEIIRLIACRFSHYLFAPSYWAYKNTKKYRGMSIDTGTNTVFDSLRKIATKQDKIYNYILVTCHRQETLYNFPQFNMVMEAIAMAQEIAPVILVLHSLTEQKLKEYNLYDGLLYNNVKMIPIQDYTNFINLMANSMFIISDGGSIQEETYYLNKPCLIMRKKTERQIGLNVTSFLSKFNLKRIEFFMKSYDTFYRPGIINDWQPTKIVVDYLEKL
jgi:UDP-N-acetylglucosamine 2-epimerase (non-hydrolysing)